MGRSCYGYSAAVSLSLLLSACTTYADVQTRPVVMLASSDKPAAQIADCIHAAMTRAYPIAYQLNRVNENGILHISAALAMGQAPSDGVMFDLAIAQRGVEVEILVRAQTDVWGHPEYPDDLPDIVHACAG